MNDQKNNSTLDRRSFLRNSAIGAAGLAFSPMILAQTTNNNPDDINVALLGAGKQGQTLMNACMKIPGVRFKAVCDIWTDFNQKRVSRTLKAYKHDNNAYVDYREMLDKEKDLDAVIIATPDFWHSEHAVACLEAGLNVYCEKEMSNTLDGAKKMVEAAKKSDKLLQIGHQRRSNPVYRHCYEKLIKDANMLGQITTINGQWNRSRAACVDPGFPKNAVIDPATLQKYGFKSMSQFVNWRWYKGLGGGPIVDLGSHQIDIYSWFLDANPKFVMASGGIDYWKSQGWEWYDNVMAIFEYETERGNVRAFYQTITTNSRAGYYETFMGDEGMINISEAPSPWNGVYREFWVEADKWKKWAEAGYIKEIKQEEEQPVATGAAIDARQSPAPTRYEIAAMLDKPPHQPHLENFFDAIRGKAKLNCPAEVGYETAATVLKVNEAVEAARKLEYKPEEFKV